MREDQTMTRYQVSAAEYLDIVKAPPLDPQTEMDAAVYVELVKGGSLLPNSPVSPEARTSTAMEDFQEWLHQASPFPVLEEFEGAIPGRKFRMDWYIPELRLAFEYDGMIDHGTRKGSEKDAMKSNLAQLNGILFIRVNARSIQTTAAYVVAEQAFALRGCLLKGARNGTS